MRQRTVGQCGTVLALPDKQLAPLLASKPQRIGWRYRIPRRCVTRTARALPFAWIMTGRCWEPSFGMAACWDPAALYGFILESTDRGMCSCKSKVTSFGRDSRAVSPQATRLWSFCWRRGDEWPHITSLL